VTIINLSYRLQYAFSFWKSAKDVVNVDEEWHFPITASVMVQYQVVQYNNLTNRLPESKLYEPHGDPLGSTVG